MRHKSIEHNRKKSIEYNRQESNNPNDSFDENDNFEADDEQENIKEISHMHEDSFSEEECEDSKSQKETQKQLVKRTRKEIRVCYYAYIIDFLKINNCFFYHIIIILQSEIKILLQSAKFDEFSIDYTKKFSEISSQLERELIPRIRTILE